jgi:predicted kinase
MDDRTAAASHAGDDDRTGADAQGAAALLLIESLIHSLLDNGALTQDQAMEAIDSALQVKEESVDDATRATATTRRSLVLLQKIYGSVAAREVPFYKD